ncbi:hypothetical protein [Acaryochloris marina]|uniref:hypothetical protein n=1 Tax=Acaryochloris marina TaxID=155978 RepID=UPI001BB072D4|nr:hypothetical protein [Acaryochloris marina]QUY45737.1 hypothetical protein I1H34_28695 [Acaryochloris marina S15]
MFKRLIVVFPLMTLFFPLPARADMESCFNRHLQTSLKTFPIKSAKHQATVEHNGLRYHWLHVYTSDTRYPLGEAVVAESSNVCQLPVFDVTGNIQDYNPYLGAEVVGKFKKQFAKQQR